MEKLQLLKVDNSICKWIYNFLTQRQQTVRVGSRTSNTITVSTGSPQGCVLSPLLFSLLTFDCTARFCSNHILKYADDTTVVGLIKDNSESAYREEVKQLSSWCSSHNLSLNVDKTREVVVDFRRAGKQDHAPLFINGTAVKKVSSVKYLGVHIDDDLTTTTNTSAVLKKAQQRFHCLRRLRKTGLPTTHLTTFYRGTVESVLTYGFTTWFGCCSARDKKRLNRLVKTASKIIGAPLPCLMELYQQRCISRATSIIMDPLHPSHHIFSLLPSRKRYSSIICRTSRKLNSFFPQAVRLINGLSPIPTYTPIHKCT